VTRFKGLGEISPKEFGQFIGPDMRLMEVNIHSLKDIKETLTFLYGKEYPRSPELYYGEPDLMAYVKNLFNTNFMEYASYVIKDRAIPHLVDGLKPVQRRILHSLFEMDDGKFHKVANVVGHCMKYHPHGDASIYSALVVLANKEIMIDRQGKLREYLYR
jgi:hypothetical protein